MKFTEVGESLAARAMRQLGLPFRGFSDPRGFALRVNCFSWLPFSGVKIRFAVVGHRWYPGHARGSLCKWEGGREGWDAGAVGVVHVGGKGGRIHFIRAGEGEVGVCGWDGGISVTAAGLCD